ncbi:MAG: YitT family protein [Bacteroidota bacterium]
MTKIVDSVKTYGIITFGLLLNALAWTAFLIPAEIVGGGLSGVATLFYFSTGFPVGVSYLIMNAILIVLAIKILGTNFGIKTVYGVLGLSFLLSLLQALIKHPIIQDDFMAAILGGILGGMGIGIVFSQGGSTGGVDIIAAIITKYKYVSIGRLILMFDVFVISSSYLIFGSLEKIVYGYVTMAVTSYAVDMVIEGSKQSMQVMIFSEQFNLIADKIGNELKRGVTFVQGKGWFTNDEKEIVMVIARRNEISSILKLVKETDPDAFISINSVMGVYGKGFEKIR